LKRPHAEAVAIVKLRLGKGLVVDMNGSSRIERSKDDAFDAACDESMF
jgi:hypothetical protein